MSVDHGRRKFLWEAAALTGVVIAPGITLYDLAQGRSPEAAAPGTVRWGLLVDMNRCATGCDACVSARDKENGLAGGKTVTDARWIRKIDMKSGRGVVRQLPMTCQHCAQPPCVDVCPTGASFKRADGIVLVDRHPASAAAIACWPARTARARSSTRRSRTRSRTFPAARAASNRARSDSSA